jgi:hypothetical protein
VVLFANAWLGRMAGDELISSRYQSDTRPRRFRLPFAISHRALLCRQHLSSLPLAAVLFLPGVSIRRPDFKEPTMEWTTPQHEEIDLNCEISSYANAEL